MYKGKGFRVYSRSEYKATKRIERALRKKSNEIGDDAETQIGYWLQQFKNRGIIDDFYRCKQHGPEDAKGIDFVIYMNDYLMVMPLQVKRKSKKAMQYHYKKHPDIPCILSLPEDTQEHRLWLLIRLYRSGRFKSKKPMFEQVLPD